MKKPEKKEDSYPANPRLDPKHEKDCHYGGKDLTFTFLHFFDSKGSVRIPAFEKSPNLVSEAQTQF